MGLDSNKLPPCNDPNAVSICEICASLTEGPHEARTEAGHAQHLKDKVHEHMATVVERVKRHEDVLKKTASAEMASKHYGSLVGAFRGSVKLQDEKNNAMFASLGEIQKAVGEHQNIIDGMEAGFDIEMSAFRKTNSDQRKMIISQGAQLETQGVELDEARKTIEFMREKIEAVGVKRDRS